MRRRRRDFRGLVFQGLCSRRSWSRSSPSARCSSTSPGMDSSFSTRASSLAAVDRPAARRGRPAIRATLYLGILVLLFSVPLGVGTAIYLEEYADKERWYNRLLEVNIQNLAAVPSIVYGILGLAFIVRGVRHRPRAACGRSDPHAAGAPDSDHRRREAIRAVPASIRRAPTRSVRRVGRSSGVKCCRRPFRASPPARSSRSRAAIGETAPLLLIGALTYIAFNPTLLGPFTALPIQIFHWSQQPQAEFLKLAASGIIVLLAMLLTLNAFAIWLRNRYQRRW